MRRAHAAFLLLSFLLGSCMGPRVTVVINELKPGMLKGKTIGIEGMVITAACWPGKDIEEPILDKTQKALMRRIKEARFCVLSYDEGARGRAAMSASAGKTRPAAASRSQPDQADYVFKIMLRADSDIHISNYGVGSYDPLLGGYSRRGYLYGSWGAFNSYTYSWRDINKRLIKAEYTLSDAHSCKILWRAEAEADDIRVSVFNSVFGYQAPAKPDDVPLKPLWNKMNEAAVRTIKKSGASSYQAFTLGHNYIVYP